MLTALGQQINKLGTSVAKEIAESRGFIVVLSNRLQLKVESYALLVRHVSTESPEKVCKFC